MQKYEANWDSLKAYEVPNWFMDDKFGIFIHWGVYAVSASENEWYPRFLYLETKQRGGWEDSDKCARLRKSHVEKWGNLKEFGYKDLIPMFKAEKWNPDEWVELFRNAGAKYIVPVAEHHDGFPMYDCSFTNWNAARMGPCRDIIEELKVSTRKAGLKFGVSSHRAYNWHYYTFRDYFDTADSANSKLYGVPHPEEAPVSYEFVLDWYERTKELIDKFSPDVLWFDFGWHRSEFEPWRPRVAAYYYNHALENGYEPALQYKDGFPDGVAIWDIERAKLDKVHDFYWQTDTSVSYKSWCYIEDDEFRNVDSIIHDLVDIVSKNGNLLLNIGPGPDGAIPEEARQLLLETGKWLKINGEAIYNTRPWKTYGEGPTGIPKAFREKEQNPYTAEDLRFTTKPGAFYITTLGKPKKDLMISCLKRGSSFDAGQIREIKMLGSEEALQWRQDENCLRIGLPKEIPGNHAHVFKMDLKQFSQCQ